jgi:hypothetical protein
MSIIFFFRQELSVKAKDLFVKLIKLINMNALRLKKTCFKEESLHGPDRFVPPPP